MTKKEMAQMVLDELNKVKRSPEDFLDSEDAESVGNEFKDGFKSGAFSAYHRIADKLGKEVDGLERLPDREYVDSEDEDD